MVCVDCDFTGIAVILLHRSNVLLVAFFSMQSVIKMPSEGFFRRKAVGAPSFHFSDEKFMFKRTWQVVFSAARNYFRHPKTTCRSPEGSGRAPLQSRCAWKRKSRKQICMDIPLLYTKRFFKFFKRTTAEKKKISFIHVSVLSQSVFLHFPI